MLQEYKVFRYRWVVLFALVPVIIATEVFWLTFAPISSVASAFYHVDSLWIDMFSISYMLMYILFTFPASWVIDRYGYRASVLTGAAITAVFGFTRFVFADSFPIALLSQFLLAIGQPFLVNISTKVPANWFPVKERSTAAGILLMAQYIGFIIPMIASPLLAGSYGIKTMLGIYAAFAAASVFVAWIFSREKPAVPPGPEAPTEAMSLPLVGNLLKNRAFTRVLLLSFVSMGIFNTLITVIEKILIPHGFTSVDAGIVGAVFVVAGIIGAVVVPLVSDKLGRRVPIFIAGIAAMGPLCFGLGFLLGMPLVLTSAAVLGFLIMGIAPVLFQHGAEVAYPVQEGVSFGLIMLVGQISGAAFVYLFNLILGFSGTTTLPMLFIIIVAMLQIPVTLGMKESGFMQGLATQKR